VRYRAKKTSPTVESWSEHAAFACSVSARFSVIAVWLFASSFLLLSVFVAYGPFGLSVFSDECVAGLIWWDIGRMILRGIAF